MDQAAEEAYIIVANISEQCDITYVSSAQLHGRVSN